MMVEPIKSKEKIEAVENYLKKHSIRNRLIFTLGCNSGLRISDILALNIEDVENKTYIKIKEKKTSKEKKFPINNKLQKLIKEYLIERKKIKNTESDSPLFLGKTKRLERTQVYRFLNEACERTGIKNTNIGTHTMRKSFGYHFYKQYNDIALLQNVLNHSSPAVTMRYIGIAQDEIDFSYRNFIL